MIDRKKLYKWCAVSAEELKKSKDLKVRLRVVKDSAEMGEIMARDLVEEIKAANRENRECRAIIPCGPKSWYKPFTRMINEEEVSMKNFIGLHMDECLDWQGRLLPENDPQNFHTFMEANFYGPVRKELRTPESQRFYPRPDNLEQMHALAMEKQPDITLGGWGQDGHVAYNQARREPYSQITLEELRNSRIRIQNNNWDTIIAMSQRSFGGAYQFVAPMSITYGLQECFSSKKIRIYSDTGAWKQTALRVLLLGEQDAEYPFTLLHDHPDVIATATEEVCRHPISENPDWVFRGINDEI